jgi:hypothetical protein
VSVASLTDHYERWRQRKASSYRISKINWDLRQGRQRNGRHGISPTRQDNLKITAQFPVGKKYVPRTYSTNSRCPRQVWAGARTTVRVKNPLAQSWHCVCRVSSFAHPSSRRQQCPAPEPQRSQRLSCRQSIPTPAHQCSVRFIGDNYRYLSTGSSPTVT